MSSVSLSNAGSVLSHTGISIAFDKLQFSVPLAVSKKKRAKAAAAGVAAPTHKQLLDDVSGVLEAGKVTAIMGASGAGKTTLLNTIAGRIPRSKHDDASADRAKHRVTGGAVSSTAAGGVKLTTKDIRSLSGYVMQDDAFLPYQTPREIVRFAADMQLGKADAAARGAKVDELVASLRLTKCADNAVGATQGQGGVERGASGGERRRTSIAQELVSDPPILFLDEPTSGLDSETAYELIAKLRSIARGDEGGVKRTVVMTIHQPSSDIMELIDNLLLMAEGQVCFFGDCALAAAFFDECGYPCPPMSNPADWYIKILNGSVRHLKEHGDESPSSAPPAIDDSRPALRRAPSSAVALGASQVTKSGGGGGGGDGGGGGGGARDTVDETTIELTDLNENGDAATVTATATATAPSSSAPAAKADTVLTVSSAVFSAQVCHSVGYFRRTYESRAQRYLPPSLRAGAKRADDDKVSAVLAGSGGGGESASTVLVDRFSGAMRGDVPSALQLGYLTRRAATNMARNMNASIGKLVQYCFVSLFSMLLFWQLDLDEDGVTNRTGLLFSSLLLWSFMPANGTILLFPQERPVYNREYAQKMYHPLLYFVAKNLVDLPFYVVAVTAHSLIIYWSTALRPGAEHFFVYLLVAFVVSTIGVSIGLFVGSAIPDVGAAMELGPSLIIPQMLIAGVFVVPPSLPVFIRWLNYCVYIRWALQSALINEFDNVKLDIPVDCPAGESPVPPATTCFEYGVEYVLQPLDFAGEQLWQTLLALIGFALAWRLLAFLTFYRAVTTSNVQ